MKKPLGNKQKIGVAVLAFSFAGFLTLASAGVIAGEAAVDGFVTLALGVYGIMCGGAAAADYARRPGAEAAADEREAL